MYLLFLSNRLLPCMNTKLPELIFLSEDRNLDFHMKSSDFSVLATNSDKQQSKKYIYQMMACNLQCIHTTLIFYNMLYI